MPGPDVIAIRLDVTAMRRLLTLSKRIGVIMEMLPNRSHVARMAMRRGLDRMERRFPKDVASWIAPFAHPAPQTLQITIRPEDSQLKRIVKLEKRIAKSLRTEPNRSAVVRMALVYGLDDLGREFPTKRKR